jgi:hypothetical protein
MRRDILGLGLLQVVACGLALAGMIAWAPAFTTAALALGLPLALSSTAQVLPMLQASGRLRTRAHLCHPAVSGSLDHPAGAGGDDHHHRRAGMRHHEPQSRPMRMALRAG